MEKYTYITYKANIDILDNGCHVYELLGKVQSSRRHFNKVRAPLLMCGSLLTFRVIIHTLLHRNHSGYCIEGIRHMFGLPLFCRCLCHEMTGEMFFAIGSSRTICIMVQTFHHAGVFQVDIY